MILAVTPVALWVAWTATVLFTVAAVAMVSAGLLVLLEERRQRALTQPEPAVHRPELPDEFVVEVHRLFPLTYHHSLRPAARFREAMERLSRMLRAP